MFQEIYIVDEEEELMKNLKDKFKQDKSLRFKNIKTKDVECALKCIPDLILINEDSIDTDIHTLCTMIREDEDNSITPIVVISSNTDEKHQLAVIKDVVEYYIERPVNEEILYYTIKNITRLLYSNRTVSPLTGLPGNVQIQAELKKRVLRRESFVVLYFDLDNFKSYNDVYGFLKGDEIIKLTARLITKSIHNLEGKNVFVGHIGGDDFVAVVDGCVDYDEICQDILAEFDVEVLKHFNDVDAEKGFLEVKNRKGVVDTFPLTSISIGVVVADEKRFANILEIGEVGAQVKNLAKMAMGSSYAIDRRKDEDMI